MNNSFHFKQYCIVTIIITFIQYMKQVKIQKVTQKCTIKDVGKQ